MSKFNPDSAKQFVMSSLPFVVHEPSRNDGFGKKQEHSVEVFISDEKGKCHDKVIEYIRQQLARRNKPGQPFSTENPMDPKEEKRVFMVLRGSDNHWTAGVLLIKRKKPKFFILDSAKKFSDYRSKVFTKCMDEFGGRFFVCASGMQETTYGCSTFILHFLDVMSKMPDLFTWLVSVRNAENNRLRKESQKTVSETAVAKKNPVNESTTEKKKRPKAIPVDPMLLREAFVQFAQPVFWHLYCKGNPKLLTKLLEGCVHISHPILRGFNLRDVHDDDRTPIHNFGVFAFGKELEEKVKERSVAAIRQPSRKFS